MPGNRSTREVCCGLALQTSRRRRRFIDAVAWFEVRTLMTLLYLVLLSCPVMASSGPTTVVVNVNETIHVTDAESVTKAQMVQINESFKVTDVQSTAIKNSPKITSWPLASAINYGQTVANSSLTGGVASVLGSFAFSTPTTIPVVGTSPQVVTFTPNDTLDYGSVAGTVNITVNAVKRLPDDMFFPSIQAAYDGIPSGSMIILAQSWPFTDKLTFSNDTAVTLTGGTDGNYSPTTGFSSVGSLTVGNGSVEISNFIIK